MKLLRKKKKSAIVFVDYEYWRASMSNLFHTRPDIRGWISSLNAEYDLKEVYFFADFLRDYLKHDVPLIREFTNNIIETQSSFTGTYQKDMSDVIILDFLYRIGFQKGSPDTMILFTGDGHFQSAVRTLVQERKKNVIVYGISGSFSTMLQAVASVAREIPDTEQEERICKEKIVLELDSIA